MTTPRDNLLRSLRREGFDTVPLSPGGFCPSQLEAFEARFGHRDVQGWFGSPCREFGIRDKSPCDNPRALYTRETLPEDISFDNWCVGHSRQPDCWHMTRMHHPLKGEAVTVDEIRQFPEPRIASGETERIQAEVLRLRGLGLASAGGLACTVWERAWYMRSMEDLMADMMMDDERATVLLDLVTAAAIAHIRIYAQAGCDIVMLGDDIGMQNTIMMSLELWRTWLKPRLKQVIDAGRAIKPDLLIFYHSCGYVTPFLNELIEVGVDVLNPVQPECMDFADVHRETGGRLSYWGTIGTQQLLPFGTPEAVRDAVRRNLEICGPQGGIVIAPTHLVEPEVPWENLVAMRDAARSFVASHSSR